MGVASACTTVERGVIGFGLDYSCAHIFIQAEISSVNLLTIQADFVTERDTPDIPQAVYIHQIYPKLYTPDIP